MKSLTAHSCISRGLSPSEHRQFDILPIRAAARDEPVRNQAATEPSPLGSGPQEAGNGSDPLHVIVEVGDFVAEVSEIAHDLRNSLAVIHGSSELLLDVEPDDGRYYAELVYEETNRLAALTQRLLELSRQERQRIQHAEAAAQEHSQHVGR